MASTPAPSLEVLFVSENAITVFASFRPKRGKEEELERLLSWVLERSRAEPGCERYDLYRRSDRGETLHLFERYRGDDALAAHRAAEHYLEYRRRVVDLLEEPIDVLVLDPIDVREGA